MKNICLCFALLVFASPSFAEEMEGFDYRRGLMQGRITVEMGRAALQLTGDAAEAMFYQMEGKEETDTGCSAGLTKRMPGLMCTKTPLKDKAPAFECFLDVNLRTAQVEETDGMCPEDEGDAAFDARGNKFPRSPVR